ncbi:hypothetical protein CF319_g5498 [Tilletia indica]|nr:hypothetical protein CF319_g5498 [Tilletia indica]
MTLPRVRAYPLLGENHIMTKAGAALVIPAKERKKHPLINKYAPEIQLEDHLGNMVSLHSTIALGRPICLYFYPLAGSPHCTTQSCSLRDALEYSPVFSDLGAIVIGISQDPPHRAKKFSDGLNLSFRLLCDVDRKYMETYHVGHALLGLINTRCTFIIDHLGIVRAALSGVWDGLGHRRFAERWLTQIEHELAGTRRHRVEFQSLAGDLAAAPGASGCVYRYLYETPETIHSGAAASNISGIDFAPRHGAPGHSQDLVRSSSGSRTRQNGTGLLRRASPLATAAEKARVSSFSEDNRKRLPALPRSHSSLAPSELPTSSRPYPPVSPSQQRSDRFGDSPASMTHGGRSGKHRARSSTVSGDSPSHRTRRVAPPVPQKVDIDRFKIDYDQRQANPSSTSLSGPDSLSSSSATKVGASKLKAKLKGIGLRKFGSDSGRKNMSNVELASPPTAAQREWDEHYSKQAQGKAQTLDQFLSKTGGDNASISHSSINTDVTAESTPFAANVTPSTAHLIAQTGRVVPSMTAKKGKRASKSNLTAPGGELQGIMVSAPAIGAGRMAGYGYDPDTPQSHGSGIATGGTNSPAVSSGVNEYGSGASVSTAPSTFGGSPVPEPYMRLPAADTNVVGNKGTYPPTSNEDGNILTPGLGVKTKSRPTPRHGELQQLHGKLFQSLSLPEPGASIANPAPSLGNAESHRQVEAWEVDDMTASGRLDADLTHIGSILAGTASGPMMSSDSVLASSLLGGSSDSEPFLPTPLSPAPRSRKSSRTKGWTGSGDERPMPLKAGLGSGSGYSSDRVNVMGRSRSSTGGHGSSFEGMMLRSHSAAGPNGHNTPLADHQRLHNDRRVVDSSQQGAETLFADDEEHVLQTATGEVKLVSRPSFEITRDDSSMRATATSMLATADGFSVLSHFPQPPPLHRDFSRESAEFLADTNVESPLDPLFPALRKRSSSSSIMTTKEGSGDSGGTSTMIKALISRPSSQTSTPNRKLRPTSLTATPTRRTASTNAGLGQGSPNASIPLGYSSDFGGVRRPAVPLSPEDMRPGASSRRREHPHQSNGNRASLPASQRVRSDQTTAVGHLGPSSLNVPEAGLPFRTPLLSLIQDEDLVLPKNLRSPNDSKGVSDLTASAGMTRSTSLPGSISENIVMDGRSTSLSPSKGSKQSRLGRRTPSGSPNMPTRHLPGRPPVPAQGLPSVPVLLPSAPIVASAIPKTTTSASRTPDVQVEVAMADQNRRSGLGLFESLDTTLHFPSDKASAVDQSQPPPVVFTLASKSRSVTPTSLSGSLSDHRKAAVRSSSPHSRSLNASPVSKAGATQFLRPAMQDPGQWEESGDVEPSILTASS